MIFEFNKHHAPTPKLSIRRVFSLDLEFAIQIQIQIHNCKILSLLV